MNSKFGNCAKKIPKSLHEIRSCASLAFNSESRFFRKTFAWYSKASLIFPSGSVKQAIDERYICEYKKNLGQR